MAIQYDIVMNFVTNMGKAKKEVESVKKGFDNLYQKSVNDEIFKDMSFKNLDPKVFSFSARNMDDFVNGTDRARISLKDMQGTFSKIMQVERLRTMGVDAEYLSSELVNIAQTSKVGKENFSAMQKNAQQMSKSFDMSALSLLFFSQAVNRLVSGAFTQMYNSFKMIDKKGITPLNRAMTKLQASFGFLSFVLMRALEPVLIPIIDGIVALVDWFAELPPGIQTLIGVIGLLVIALTTLSLWFLTIKLAAQAAGINMMVLQGIVPKVISALSGAGKTSALATSLGMGGLAGAAILAVEAIVALLLWMYIFDQASKSTQVYSEELGVSFDDMGMNVTEAFNDMTFGVFDFAGIFQFLGTVVKNVMENIDMYVQAGFVAIASTVMLAISNTANAVSFITGLIKTIVGAAIDGIVLVINALITDWNAVQKLIGNKGDFPLIEQTSIAGDGIKQMAKSLSDTEITAYKYLDALKKIGEKENEILAMREAAKINEQNMAIFNEGRISSDVSSPSVGISKEEFMKQSEEMNLLVAEAAKKATETYKTEVVAAAPALDQAVKDSIVPAVTNNIDVNNGSSGSLIANTPLYAEDFVITYADTMKATSPYLMQTTFEIFSAVGNVMYNTTHIYVQKTISDIQRAINKMKELQAMSGSSGNTTNNTTNANKITINASNSTDISKALTKVNMAVPTARL